MFLVLTFTRGWVDNRAMVRSERNMSLKNPVRPPGIDPGTFRLVAQRLNHYTTRGPTDSISYKYEYRLYWLKLKNIYIYMVHCSASLMSGTFITKYFNTCVSTLRASYPVSDSLPRNFLYFWDSACAKYCKYIPQTDHEYGATKNVVKRAEIKEKFGYCTQDKTCYIQGVPGGMCQTSGERSLS